MIIGINASKASNKLKTGIDNTIYQIILNLQIIDKVNTYYLYTDKPLEKNFLTNKNFHQKLIPFKKFWHKFRLPLALLRDKPDAFFESTNKIPTFSPKNSTILIHDLAFKYFPHMYSKLSLIEQEGSIKSALAKGVKIVLTLKANKEDFLKFYKTSNKIKIIPLGYNNKLFFDNQNHTAMKKADDPYFIFLGRIEKRKNVSNIVKAFNIFKEKSSNNYKLILVGAKGYGYDEIKKEINNSKFSKDIIEKGYLNDSDLNQFLSCSRGLVFPSFYEGFGIPVLEAFACSVPVIISDIKTLKEVAADAAIVVNPKSPSDIAKKLKFLSKDSDDLSRLVDKGKLRLKQFNWEKTAVELLEFITR